MNTPDLAPSRGHPPTRLPPNLLPPSPVVTSGLGDCPAEALGAAAHTEQPYRRCSLPPPRKAQHPPHQLPLLIECQVPAIGVGGVLKQETEQGGQGLEISRKPMGQRGKVYGS